MLRANLVGEIETTDGRREGDNGTFGLFICYLWIDELLLAWRAALRLIPLEQPYKLIVWA